MKFIRIVSIILFACNGLTQGQNTGSSLKEQAKRHFDAGNFTEALPLYSELVNKFPKEPEYQYGKGVCLVNLNGDLDEAISLLKPAPVSEFASSSIYYLGRAYHLNYAFEEAIKAYSRYMLKGNKSEIKLLDVGRHIEMARNGLDYTRSGQPVTVINVQPLQADQLQIITEVNSIGKMMKKPIEFCSKTDTRNGYKPWMYLPAYTEVNEYIYVAGYEQGKKNKKQLFRIKNINHETWGFPEPLNELINTSYNEEFPFFDAGTSTLYFSSDGHSSMGGYDIFKSVYDWNTKTWSRPQNLGFPINSPHNDFAFLTDDPSNTVSFVSDRTSPPNYVNLYRVKIIRDAPASRYFSLDEIRKASELTVSVHLPDPDEEVTGIDELTTKPDLNEHAAINISNEKPDYNKVLAEALMLQVRADSTARIARELRITAKETPDDDNRKQLITDILRNEKLAKSLQRDADQKFTEARILKNDLSDSDTVMAVAEEINDIRFLQFQSNNDDQEVNEATVPVIATVLTNEKIIKADLFSVATQSPYSDSNPIPPGTVLDTGLVYRIQLGVFSKAKPNDAFGGFNPVCYEKQPGSSVIKYYAGLFYSLNGVTKALETIRSSGYPDAFTVAYYNGNLITTEKAREIEFAGFKL